MNHTKTYLFTVTLLTLTVVLHSANIIISRDERKKKDSLQLSINYFKEKDSVIFIKSLHELSNTYLDLSKKYESKKDYFNACNYYELHSQLEDSLLKSSISGQISEISNNYETEKKQKEIQILTTDNAIQESYITKQKFRRNGAIIGLIILLGIGLILFRRYNTKKKLNFELNYKNSQLTQKNNLIENQNEKIIDSINYAKRIQQSMLLSENEVKKIVADSFIFYQPKDIVSGDFYWIAEIQNQTIIAVVDCTGHGVHGAFMSMIGYTLLNQIVIEKQIVAPNEILNELNIAVSDLLQKDLSSGLSHDGMSVALCTIDLKTKILKFSGAKAPLYVIQNNQLKEIKPSNHAIGNNIKLNEGKQHKSNFAISEMQLTTNSSIYLCTDGYKDQFSSTKNKRFGSQKLKELLLDYHQLDLEEQKEKINSNFENWKQTATQTDDILIIGIRV